MARIQVHGTGVTLYVTEISPEVAQELTQTGVSIERFEQIRLSESAHAAGIRDDMEVFVDGRRISAPPEAQSQETPVALEAGKHYLVVRETAEGRWLDIETAEPFDADKFSARVSTYLLSDGESITVTQVEYAGASATGETETIDEDATVIYPNGASEEVLIAGAPGDEDDELADEDDDEDEFLVVATSPAKPAKRPKAKAPPVKKTPAKGTAKKAAGKKAPAKKAIPKKPAAKNAAAKKATAKRAAAKKAPAKKAAPKKAAKKAAAKTRAAKKAPARKKGRSKR
jgi:hypothetical protein